MENISVTLINGPELKTQKGTSVIELAGHSPSKPLAAIVNNRLIELTEQLYEDCTLDFVDISRKPGLAVYQRGASFLMAYAVNLCLGPGYDVSLRHSINKNLFCELSDGETPIPVDEALIKRIEDAMRNAVTRDMPIERRLMPVTEARNRLSGYNTPSTRSLKFQRSTNIRLYFMDGYYDYFYGAMVPSAGYIHAFRLVPDRNGFILQMPMPNSENDFQELKNPLKIRQVYDETAKWSKILEIDSVSSLNEAICASRGGDIIRISEALHEKRLAAIADDIYNGKKSVVLIAGPSSSGKTTFSERLCVQLKVLGLKPWRVSLDNYFKNREFVPKDEFGKPDFESFDYLDAAQLNLDILRLLSGESVDMPIFNFYSGTREYRNRSSALPDGGVLVLEGIHGLNSALSEAVPADIKYKVFISAFTQINIDRHNRIPTSDARLIRRVVRDMRSRGYEAWRTLDMWESVQRGEVKNIFPYQDDADAVFNSALTYELCIMKQYAEPLLYGIGEKHRCYPDARRLLAYLDSIVAMPADDVPNNSILREFIGGSCFKV